ncbi:MAG TPA: YiiX/YebB-like N1pC/P60 family cysteine hydrolase [Spirochaetota bacterium]|nr:YiiX/YebB-like N1pC/P60 family cysteine hydrolase [Spirochaetota bacterium]HPQ54531.1 YiiX/YebB-like N1pC/P60 family cysteine hydrolase [Spirochaetota bacterium]
MYTKKLSAVVFILLCACNTPDQDNRHKTDLVIRNIRNAAKNGDLILTRGTGFISTFIVNTLRENQAVSHIGIVIRDNDSFFVLHILPDRENNRIRKESLHQFFKDTVPDSAVLIRTKHAPGDAIAASAITYLKKNISFDYYFDLKSKNEMYCTEYVWNVLRDSTGRDVLNKVTINGTTYLGFASFLNNIYFERIYF